MGKRLVMLFATIVMIFTTAANVKAEEVEQVNEPEQYQEIEKTEVEQVVDTTSMPKLPNSGNLKRTSSPFYIVEKGLTWVNRIDYIDVGVAFESNDPNALFQWQEYNIDTKEWKVISPWKTGNWTSWKSNAGNYWLHCEMKTSDGNNYTTKTISFRYYAGDTQLTGTYLGGHELSDGTILMGSSSQGSPEANYQYKVYDVNNNSWIHDSGKTKAQWASYFVKTGTYWAHYELYTKDGRLADTKTFAFNWKDPVRRGLILGNTVSPGSDGGTEATPMHDLNSMYNMMSWTSFNGSQFNQLTGAPNLTKKGVENQIATSFSGTQEGDISYIYILAHGGENGNIHLGVDGLVVTPSELRSWCDRYINGTAVVMVSACFSGNLINRGINSNSDTEFNGDTFVKEFTASPLNSRSLVGPKYKVLCSSLKTELSWTKPDFISNAADAWTRGAGWDPANNKTSNMLADVNGDNKVTLHEMYVYSYNKVLSNGKSQHVTVYPENDSTVIFGRY